MGTTASRAAALVFLCVVFVHPVQTRAEAQAKKAGGAGPSRALLVEGTTRSRGVPGFGRNTIACIEGQYRVPWGASYQVVKVWATRESLYVQDATWTSTPMVGYSFMKKRVQGPITGKDPLSPVIALSLSASSSPDPEPSSPDLDLFAAITPFESRGLGADPSQWNVILGFQGESGDGDAPSELALRRHFLEVFMARFSYFLSSAKGPEDVSFPAVLNL